MPWRGRPGWPATWVVAVVALLAVALVAGSAVVVVGRRSAATEVLWHSGFSSSATWQREHGVVAAGELRAQVSRPGPQGRRDTLEVTFGRGGSRWGMDVRSSFEALELAPREEVWLSYDVWFDPGFQFLGDGKMGGLAGTVDGVEPFDVSSGGQYDPRSFSVRAVWTEGGGLEMYLYAAHGAGRAITDDVNAGFGIAEPFRTPEGHTGAVLSTGQWHRVEHRVRLNTPGRDDGVYELWLDGVRGVHVDDIRYREREHGEMRIDQVFGAFFFGGPPETYPSRTNRLHTDDWVLSASRLGQRPWRTRGEDLPQPG